MNKPKILALILCLGLTTLVAFENSFATETDLEYSLDILSSTIALPKVFAPSIDMSGRGYHQDPAWPQSLASKEAISQWQQDIGFSGIYRISYNFWEISQLEDNKILQNKMLANYERVIKDISDRGGTVILNIFGAPRGQGKVLDQKSCPINLKAFKNVVKDHIKYLSGQKKYNIWYEVWNAADLDDFFLGRTQEYCNLYKAVAEAVRETEKEFNIHIPVGGPSTSWWFRNAEGNTVLTAEKSLIYELVRFCYHYRLPLDFVSWHAYTTDPKAEKESTTYRQSAVSLLRDWLAYFNFKDTLLIVDEWNYDRGFNIAPERKDAAYITASYIPSRLRSMYEAGLDAQVFFSLEDFQDNKKGVDRNTGVFGYLNYINNPASIPKSLYNLFRMLGSLGSLLFVANSKWTDDFVGVIATKGQDETQILIYNYIDPDAAANYIGRNIAALKDSERKFTLSLLASRHLDKLFSQEQAIKKLRTTNKVKELLEKARKLHEMAARYKATNRKLNLTLKNVKQGYVIQRARVNASCNTTCEFISEETKNIPAGGQYQESMVLAPYSVEMLVIKKKPEQILIKEVAHDLAAKQALKLYAR